MDSSVQINGSIINTPSIPQTDFLPVILHPTPVRQEAPLPPDATKQETPPPPVPEKKATAHIRIPLHEEQGSVRDQMIEIEWPVESATELLLLIQGLPWQRIGLQQVVTML